MQRISRCFGRRSRQASTSVRQLSAAQLNEIAQHLKIQQPSDWYRVTTQSFLANPITSQVAESLYSVLQRAYPEHNWERWRFISEQNRIMSDIALQREFLEWIGRTHLNIRKLDDWYGVSFSQLESAGGRKVVRRFSSSLASTLLELYPDHPWEPWRFANAPRGFWNDVKNQRLYLDWLRKKLELPLEAGLDGWYQVTNAELRHNKGHGLLKVYGNSVSAILKQLFPSHDWQEWRFKTLPRNLWSNLATQRRFLDWLSPQIGIRDMNDWYAVSLRQIRQRDTTALSALLSSQYNSSFAKLVMTVYPEHPWDTARFVLRSEASTLPSTDHAKTHRTSWRSHSDRVALFDGIMRELNFTSMDGWYSLTTTKLHREHGAGGLLRSRYGDSISRALADIYPGHKWHAWRFREVPKSFWDKTAHHKEFFDWLLEHLKISLDESYYVLTEAVIRHNGGGHLLKEFYHGRVHQALIEIYPSHDWHPWLFPKTPSSFWAKEENILKYFDWLGPKLGVDSLEGWYQQRRADLESNGGSSLLDKFDGSLAKPLMKAYPNHRWQPWRFAQTPSRFWDDKQNRKKFIASAATDLGLLTLADWYKVSPTLLRRISGGEGFLQHYEGNLSKALSDIFPEHHWESR